MDAVLAGREISVAYQQNMIIPPMDVKIEKECITSIIGPNGCGKSTLLKALSRTLPIRSGQVLSLIHIYPGALNTYFLFSWLCSPSQVIWNVNAKPNSDGSFTLPLHAVSVRNQTLHGAKAMEENIKHLFI